MSDENTTPGPDATPSDTAATSTVDLPEFDESDEGISTPDMPMNSEQLQTKISAIHDVPVQVSAVLGSASMQVSQLLKLSRGAVIELDRKVGEAIDVFVNNRLVARGEVVVVDDHLGITMTEIIKSDNAA